MRVCMVSHSAGDGGAERALLEAIDALAESGVECVVVAPGRGPLTAALSRRNVRVVVMPFTWWLGVRTPPWKRALKVGVTMAAAAAVAIRVARLRCDIIYTNTLTIVVGALVAQLLRLPHVWHVHEYGQEHHGLSFEWGERRAHRVLGRATAVIATSNAVAAKYRSAIAADRLHVIYQSVAAPSMVRSGPVTHTAGVSCVMVGALQEGKGHADAIRALAVLKSWGRRVTLNIVGEGETEYQRELEALVREYGLQESTTFSGFARDPYPQLFAADIVLVCSRFEAFGRVTVEGMLAGRPVIGASSGATVELIRDGQTGLLYSAGDAEQLARRIDVLARDPAMRQELGSRAQRWARTAFTRERYGSDLLAVLQSAASGSSQMGQPHGVAT